VAFVVVFVERYVSRYGTVSDPFKEHILYHISS